MQTSLSFFFSGVCGGEGTLYWMMYTQWAINVENRLVSYFVEVVTY